ncbi:MAG TPA: hypothetical protein VJ818_03180 [Actinomycetota bacterium]|nr:hypothetical protein [Actinomycetota bacterium]
MTKIEFDVQTSLSPEKVKAMLLDFSDRRPDTWPGLGRNQYKVYSIGETSAEIREGNKRPNVWARERYDWSKPGIVRWEVVESNFSAPGSFLEAHLGPKDGGTNVHIVWDRTATSPMGRIALALIKLTRGAPVKASFKAAFSKAEKS